MSRNQGTEESCLGTACKSLIKHNREGMTDGRGEMRDKG
jgi:hypothetical protein